MAQQAYPDKWSILDLGGMFIHSLSTTSSLFTTYSFLTGLYLNHNNLHTLPPVIKQLRTLMVLDVSANKIRWLPQEIGELRELREIWAFDNYLETLPWEMAWLHSLEFLGIEGNPIMKLNPAASGNSSNNSLDLQQLHMHDLRKSMRYENPVVEVMFREGVQAAVAWLRDNMPVDVMLPSLIAKRRWIRKGGLQTDSDGNL